MNPLDRSTTGLEILIMLIIAFILGFLVAWAYYRNRLKVQELDGSRLSRKPESTPVKASTPTVPKTPSTPVPKIVGKNEKETAALNKVAAKRDTINFGRIGSASEADKDDLKIISGVGPFIEKKLNALGIYTFAQVSKFTTEDEKNVTDAIEFFPGRIARDQWVKQAKKLAKK
ncbi:MAG: hypothetical protein AB8B61_06545 [Cyclobacteriaceae bacterium]